MIIKLFGIFNLKSIQNTPEYKYLYEKFTNENKLEDISNNRKKSFILYGNNDDLKGFISNIFYIYFIFIYF